MNIYIYNDVYHTIKISNSLFLVYPNLLGLGLDVFYVYNHAYAYIVDFTNNLTSLPSQQQQQSQSLIYVDVELLLETIMLT
jgi:hypothetical protein